MRLALAGICLGTALIAGAANIDLSVKELMRDLGSTMLRMLPAAYSETPDRVLLLENLVRLEYLLDQTEPHFSKSSESRVPLTLLQERLGEAKSWGTRGNAVMLQNTVSEAFALCATCHVQDRVTRRAFASSQVDALDNYLAVEYHFLTRDYTAAMASMKQYFERSHRTQNRDSIVLQRILTVGVEVRRELDFSIMQLNAALKYLEPDDYNFDRVSDWVKVLRRLNSDSETLQSPVGKDLAGLDRFLLEEWPDIRTLLSYSEQEAYWIVIRGELNRLLKSENADLPQIYYWLAVIDRELQYRFYGSLSRAYLERCVNEFPGDEYATRCLDEYELLVLISFSGSSGTFVPYEVNERIQAMRKLIAANR